MHIHDTCAHTQAPAHVNAALQDLPYTALGLSPITSASYLSLIPPSSSSAGQVSSGGTLANWYAQPAAVAVAAANAQLLGTFLVARALFSRSALYAFRVASLVSTVEGACGYVPAQHR